MGSILMAGGGGGVDTSVVTATKADVLLDKTFIDKAGETVAGTMPNLGSQNKSLNCGGSYTIPKGYHSGTGNVTANSLASQTAVDSGKTAVTAAYMVKDYQAWADGTVRTGSMTNNGAVTKALSFGGSYTIPAGYHNGSGKVTGPSATDKAASTITPTTKDQTVASGTYLTGTLTVKGDANLVAANILSGKSIFGVSGSMRKYGVKTGTAASSSSTKTFYRKDNNTALSYSYLTIAAGFTPLAFSATGVEAGGTVRISSYDYYGERFRTGAIWCRKNECISGTTLTPPMSTPSMDYNYKTAGYY